MKVITQSPCATLGEELEHLRRLQAFHFSRAAELAEKLEKNHWAWFDARGLSHEIHDLESAVQYGRAMGAAECALGMRLMVPKTEGGT